MEGRGGYWFSVNTTFLILQHRLASHVVLHDGTERRSTFSCPVASHTGLSGSISRASLMLGTAQWEAKGTVGL